MISWLIVNDFPPIRGGQARYYECLCRALADKDIKVLAPRGPGAVSVDASCSFPIERRSYLVPIPGVEKIVKIFWPLGVFLLASRRSSIKAVHCGHVLSTGVMGLINYYLTGLPYVVYTHSADILEYQRNPFIKRLLMRVLRYAWVVVANSHFTRKQLLDLGVDPVKIRVAFPRVDYEALQRPVQTNELSQRLGLHGKRVLLSVNRLVMRKGNDVVIQAVARLKRQFPDLVYLMVGQGPYVKTLKGLVERHGLAQHVIFAGGLSDVDVLRAYHLCDVFIMASREIKAQGDAEGFGISFLEANALGKPVIGGRSGGIPDAVVDGQTGRLVDPQDIEQIVEAVTTLLNNPALARQWGEQGRQRVADHFDWRRGVPELSDLFDALPSPRQVRTRRKKVVHIITRLDAGGSSTNTIETVARLDPAKYRVLLIAGKTQDPDGHIRAYLKQRGVRCLFLKDLQRQVSLRHDARALCQLYYILRRRRCDIVHTHTSKAGILGRWAAWMARIPCIIHTPHGHIFYGYFSWFTTKCFMGIERVTSLVTDRIITLTRLGKADHARLKIAPDDKLVSIYSGINIEDYEREGAAREGWRSRWKIPMGAFVFGSVGRLTPIKGHEVTIDSFAVIAREQNNAYLLFVGEGEERERLENRVMELGLGSRVRFVGFQEDVRPFFEMMDAFVLASRNEGMGRVILEAMASHLPILATRVGGIPELVLDGENGRLVEPGDIDDLASAMRWAIEHPRALARMRIKSAHMVNESFSVQKMAKDIEQLYEALTEEKT